MKPRKAALIAAFSFAFLLPAAAHDFRAGSLEIDHPWSRATPPGAPVAGGYLKIENDGSTPDRLLVITSDIASKAEIHESAVTDGVASMRLLEKPIEIAPGQSVELKLGGTHIMFMKPVRTLKAGDRFTARLTFEKAGDVDVEFVVQGMGSRAPEETPDHGQHGATLQ